MGLGLARARRLPLPVRGGGHDCARLRSVDDGVVVDLCSCAKSPRRRHCSASSQSGGEIGDHAGYRSRGESRGLSPASVEKAGKAPGLRARSSSDT
jgi:hypothetical protein